jgi:HK97 family phage prohead protease
VTTKDFKLEIKSVEEDGTFEGYLSVFDVVDLTGDLVEKGAFGKTIKEHPDGIVMLWQHDPSKPIGKMFLTEDDYGLKVKGVLALGVSQAQEAYTLLKAGIVRGMSIGYKAIKK